MEPVPPLEPALPGPQLPPPSPSPTPRAALSRWTSGVPGALAQVLVLPTSAVVVAAVGTRLVLTAVERVAPVELASSTPAVAVAEGRRHSASERRRALPCRLKPQVAAVAAALRSAEPAALAVPVRPVGRLAEPLGRTAPEARPTAAVGVVQPPSAVVQRVRVRRPAVAGPAQRQEPVEPGMLRSRESPVAVAVAEAAMAVVAVAATATAPVPSVVVVVVARQTWLAPAQHPPPTRPEAQPGPTVRSCSTGTSTRSR